MVTSFKNPSNNYIVEVPKLAWLWVFLWAPIYFSIKGIWSHALISIVLAICTMTISTFIYPFFAKSILKKHYLKNKQFDQKYYESLQENNSQFDETIYFESVKNRLLLFDGNQVHGVKNLIDPNNKTRLTYVAFFKFIMDPSLKSFVVESKRQLVG